MTYKSITDSKSGEIIREIVRKHWYVYVKSVILFIIIVIIPLAFAISVYATLPDFAGSNSGKITGIFAVLYLIFALQTTYIMLMNDAFDIVIITNQRIINIDQIGFLNRKVSETALEDIQDVKYEQSGSLSHVFDFGSIEVQSAAAKATLMILTVPHPQSTVEQILQAKDAREDSKHEQRQAQNEQAVTEQAIGEQRVNFLKKLDTLLGKCPPES